MINIVLGVKYSMTDFVWAKHTWIHRHKNFRFMSENWLNSIFEVWIILTFIICIVHFFCQKVRISTAMIEWSCLLNNTLANTGEQRLFWDFMESTCVRHTFFRKGGLSREMPSASLVKLERKRALWQQRPRKDVQTRCGVFPLKTKTYWSTDCFSIVVQ